VSRARRVALLFVAAAIVLAAASTPSFAAPATVSCGGVCGTDTTLTSRGAHSPVESCIHDPSCGGGGALTTSGAPLLVALAGASAVAVIALLVRRVRRAHHTRPAGILEAARLFRPPRLLLGI